MIVSLSNDDVARLGVNERRIAGKAFIEADYCPLIEQQRTAAWSYVRVVRVAVQSRHFALRLRPWPSLVSHSQRCPL